MAVTRPQLHRLETLTRSAPDLVSLWRSVTPPLARAVPHFEAPCFFTLDPASLLVTSHFQEGLPEIPAEWLGREYAAWDYNCGADVLASTQGWGTLHAATGGRPDLATKYHEEMQPFGCEQELVVALRTRDGESWGLLGLYRENGRPLFDEREIAVVRGAAPLLAEAARHTLRRAQAEDPDVPEAPGLVILDEELAVLSRTEAMAQWSEDLGGSTTQLPAAVYAVAGRALRGDGQPAVSRVRALTGRWMVLHGALLRPEQPDQPRQVSVVVEPADPQRLAPLLMRAYGLSAREREVTRLVLRGSSTAEIATALTVTEGTVQQHLKSIFDKTGVRSRRALVGQVFAAHYEPRVRDNEQRTSTDRPSRDGPV